MARYDRLAALSAPQRAEALPCWSVLSDLEGNERDADAGRRARLRFLALRPVYRLAVSGFDAVPADSFDRQVERVREELGQLPARDPERAALARFLNELRTRHPDAVVSATLQVSDFAEASGHLGSAGEYARCALGLARSLQRDRLAAGALRVLAHVALAGANMDEAEALATLACELALAGDDRAEWIRAMDELAATQRGRGNAGAAHDTLLQALHRARDWGEDPLIGLALARLCAHAALQGQFDRAVEHGWSALRLLNGAERTRVLLHLGESLAHLGLVRAAERCYSVVAQRASDPAARAAAQTGLVLAAGAAGQTSVFQERRMAALRDLQHAPRLTRAALYLSLAEATLAVGDDVYAREHVRDALSLMGGHGPRALTRRAESVLQQLESAAAVELAQRLPLEIPEQTRRIAAELELVADSVVAAE